MKKSMKKWLMLCLLLVGAVAPLIANNSLEKANKFYELKDFKSAIPAYLEAFKEAPNETEIFGKLADCYRHTNDMNQAAAWYMKALQLPNPRAEHFFEYGLVLQALGKYDIAKYYFSEYSKVNPAKGQQFAKACDFAAEQIAAPIFYTVENLTINSPAADYAPAFYKDVLVYVSARTDIKNGQNDSDEKWQKGLYNQVFVSRFDKGNLSRSQLLRQGFKTRMNEGSLSFTPDGRMVAYTKNNFVDGVRNIPSAGGKMRIYFTEVAGDDQWGTREIPFEYNNVEAYNTGYPCFSTDGKALYFASDMPGGYGGFDIYVSYKTGANWSAPVNLGTKVNSAGNEISPFFDGKDLYFSSDFLPGLGGFDIFKAEQIGKNWDRVLHLGNGVNSSYDDYDFIYNSKNKIGYFASNRSGGKGLEDIYSVKTSSERVELLVVGDNGLPISEATIDFTACGEGTAKTNANGRFNFLVLSGLNCPSVVVSKEGYEPKTISIKSSNSETRLLEVRLTKESNVEGRYIGTVISSASGALLEKVMVKITNLTSRDKIEIITDAKGRYVLDLLPNNQYLLNFSKTGFLTVNKTVDTKNGTDKTILGVQLMESVAGIDGRTDVPTPYEILDDPKSPLSGTYPENLPSEAYEVQIGVFSNPDKEKFNPLRALGFVYSEPRGDQKVFKVGAFRTREEADEVKKEVVTRGFTGAFVRKQTNKALIARVLIDKTSSGTSPKASNPPGVIPKPQPSTPPVATPSVVFRLQLGVYRDANLFDDSKIKDLGKVESVPYRDGLTLIVFGAFKTYEEAKSFESKIESRGLPKPVVIAFKNGVKVDLKSVL